MLIPELIQDMKHDKKDIHQMTEHTKTDSKDRIEKIQKEIDSDHFNTMNDLLFKFTFGREERKHITIDFLNTVLRKSLGHLIKDITFIPTEQIPQRAACRRGLQERSSCSHDQHSRLQTPAAEIPACGV